MFDQNDKSKEEEFDRTCAERGWVIEGCDGGEGDGKRRQGQPRKGMISDLEEAIRDLKKEDSDSSKEEDNDPGEREECAYVKMKRMAEDRERWREWVPGTGLTAEDQ